MWKPTNIPTIVKAVQNPPTDRHVGPRRWGAWSIFWAGRGWGPGLFILESRELRGWENQRLFSAVPRDRTRDSEHKLKHFKFHLHYLTHEGNPTLVQAGQAGCGVSIRGDGQDPSGHGPSPAGPAGMAWLRWSSEGPAKPSQCVTGPGSASQNTPRSLPTAHTARTPCSSPKFNLNQTPGVYLLTRYNQDY